MRRSLYVSLLLTALLCSPASEAHGQTGATTYNLHDGSVTLPAGSPCHVVLRSRGRGQAWRPLPTLRGLRLSEIRTCFGAPSSEQGRQLTYRFVDGGDCYWGTELQLTVRGERVRRARMRRYSTGMHCEMEPF